MCVNTLPYMCECQKTLPCVLIPENFAKCVNICVNSRKPEQKLPHYLCPLLVNQNWRLQPLEGCKRDLCLKVELLRVWFNWLDVSVIWTFSKVFKGWHKSSHCYWKMLVFCHVQFNESLVGSLEYLTHRATDKRQDGLRRQWEFESVSAENLSWYGCRIL